MCALVLEMKILNLSAFETFLSCGTYKSRDNIFTALGLRM